MMRGHLRCLLLGSLLSFAALADRPVIDLNGARVQSYPLAVARALGDPQTAGTIQTVLSQDFEHSGLFKLLDPASVLARDGLTDIDYPAWASVGAQGLVKLSCTAAVTCEFHLYDVGGARELLHGTYSAPPAGLRQVAHRFGDDVVRYFTQEPGILQTRIAYVRETASGKQIVVADSDGYGPQALTGASINLLPGWTPDGKTIAFTSLRDGSGAHIYSVDVSSRQIRPLVLMGDFASGPIYSPDGLKFTYSASVHDNTDIYVSQADGSAGRRLTDSRAIDVSATWSPDGHRLAFISDRAGTPQVYTMLADGTELKRLTFQGNYNQEPAWSPKGDLITFSGRDEKRSFDIYTVNVETGKVARLTQNAGTNEKPSWSPNGRYILYSSTRSGRRQLWVMNADGTGQRQLTAEKMGASDPAWGPISSVK
jgi:TolB protein